MPTSWMHTVSGEILEKIRNDEISPNEIITEAMLCDMLKISRTPVREALIELIAKGVLEKVPRKGYRVKELDTKSKLNVYTVLASLDALAAKCAIVNMTEEDFLKMEEAIDLIDIAIKYKNYPNYYSLQEQFHQVYIDNCDNPFLQKMLQEIKTSITHYTYYSKDIDKLFDLCKEVNEEHRHILKLFREGKAEELARFLSETHWGTKDLEMI